MKLLLIGIILISLTSCYRQQTIDDNNLLFIYKIEKCNYCTRGGYIYYVIDNNNDKQIIYSFKHYSLGDNIRN